MQPISMIKTIKKNMTKKFNLPTFIIPDQEVSILFNH
jgi:hypothetical protein